MADALQAAGRSYIKPLAFDAATDVVLPDFILTDTDAPATCVEVWGLPGREQYERRKADKIAHYQQTAAHLIEWNVHDPLPSLRRRAAFPGGHTSDVPTTTASYAQQNERHMLGAILVAGIVH